MTVESQIPYQSYTANGLQTSFALGFYVEDKGNFFVKKDDSVVNVNDYIYDSTTNSISFNTAPPQDCLVEIERVTSVDRSTTYATFNNSFRPEVLNYDIDRIWRKLQELAYTDSVLFLKLIKEISDRIAVDTALQAQIDSLDDQVSLNTTNIEQLINNLSQEIAERIRVDTILKEMFLSIIDTAINEGTVNALAILHADSVDELEAYARWEGRTIYVKGEGQYIFSAQHDQWIPEPDKTVNLYSNAYAIYKNGYPKDSVVQLANGTEVYSTANNNLNDPNINMANWSYKTTDQQVAINAVTGLIPKTIGQIFYDQIIDVSWFGAKGDWNKTTQTGTDDTVAVQNAINYLATLPTRRGAGKRGLKFPKGSYRLSSITFPASLGFGIDILGEGVKTTNLYFDHNAVNPAITCEIEFTQFKDISLIGSLNENWIRPRTVGFLGKLPSKAADIDAAFFNCEIIAWDTFAQIYGRGCIFESCMVGLILKLIEIVVTADQTYGADSDLMQSKYATMRHYTIRNTRFDNVSRAYAVSGTGFMLDHLNNFVFVGNDITSMDILLDASTATIVNSVFANNTALGSFATKVFNVKALQMVNILGNSFNKVVNYTAIPTTTATATEYIVDSTSVCRNVNISNNIFRSIRSSIFRNTSTTECESINIVNNNLAEFGSYKGGNTAISAVVLSANCKGLNIIGNTFQTSNINGTYYLFNFNNLQKPIDAVISNNYAPFKFEDSLYAYQPVILVNNVATTGTYTTQAGRYLVNGNNIEGTIYLSGTVPETSGDVSIKLPTTTAIAELSAFSSVLSGKATKTLSSGITSTGYLWTDAIVSTTSQAIELNKEKDLVQSRLSAADIPSTYSLVIKFNYRIK